MHREHTKEIKIGNIVIGGGNKIAIQSMTNTKTSDIDKTLDQILELKNVGCDIVRMTIPDKESGEAVKEIKSRVAIPLVGDIHFDYKMAILAIENGIDKIRINPGNIGGKDRTREVVECAKAYNIPIRIGVNSGSLEKDILEKAGRITGEALVESAIRNIEMVENFGFNNIVVSIKASDVNLCLDAHIKLIEKTNYPIHVGITEAGTINGGVIKSSVGLGAILSRGIGDTIRVSLSGNPVNEIPVARSILSDLSLKNDMVKVIACPTCGRTNINLEDLALKVEKLVSGINKDIKVAVMGCVVNGPGEAREADIGVCGGIGEGLIIKKGEIIKKVSEDKLLEELKKEILKL